MSELALEPVEWKNAQWAFEKGMYTKLFDTNEEMDKALSKYTNTLSSYNPEALFEMKKILWSNTSHWDQLLTERALISGKLVLSDFTKKALAAFKK
jgi:methylglutaconyl-CoA hydratase